MTCKTGFLLKCKYPSIANKGVSLISADKEILILSKEILFDVKGFYPLIQSGFQVTYCLIGHKNYIAK